CATGAPHLLQNRESGGSSVPHDPHKSPAAVSAPRPSPAPSTSVSCHRWSAIDRHIAVLFPRRSFETLICRRFRGISRKRTSQRPTSRLGVLANNPRNRGIVASLVFGVSRCLGVVAGTFDLAFDVSVRLHSRHHSVCC